MNCIKKSLCLSNFIENYMNYYSNNATGIRFYKQMNFTVKMMLFFF